MQKNYGIKFLGIGGALPKKVVRNTDLEKLYDTTDEWIFKRTGIKERRVIDENSESGLSLSFEASLQALNNSKIKPLDIDLIIVATCTPDNLYPSMACMLQGKLGANKAVCFDISAACSGFIYSLVTAAQFIYNGVYKNVLVVGVDIHSRFMDWSERSVSVLFGDGAGAVVMSSCLAKDDELLAYSINSSSDTCFDLKLSNKNISYDSFKNTISPNTVLMNGKAIFEFGVKVVPDAVNKQLDLVNLKPNEIDFFIPHQANQRIIDGAAKKIGFSEEQVISNVQSVGNTSSASIPLALFNAIKSGKLRKTPSKILLVGFGAGLTWGTAIINWNINEI